MNRANSRRRKEREAGQEAEHDAPGRKTPDPDKKPSTTPRTETPAPEKKPIGTPKDNAPTKETKKPVDPPREPVLKNPPAPKPLPNPASPLPKPSEPNLPK